MPQRAATVRSSAGLHARSAQIFVGAAAASGLPVTIAHKGGDPVDAHSILMVMALGIEAGSEVVLAAEGEGADTVLENLVQIIETDLDSQKDK